MTPTPQIGDTVHYHSYGTPGGEYRPEPRAAIVTEVRRDVDFTELNESGLSYEVELDGDGGGFVSIEDHVGTRLRFDQLPATYTVGLAVLNPTGIHLNRGVPFAETPTPGHWNWRELVTP